MLKYSVEQLVHFTCECGYHWTHSGEIPNWQIGCPKCDVCYEGDEFEQITDRPLIEAFSDEELANEMQRRESAKFVSAYDKIYFIWLERMNHKPPIVDRGLNGALGSLVRTGGLNGMSFDRFLEILNDDNPSVLFVRGIGKKSIKNLREYFKTNAISPDAGMPQRGVK